MECLLTDQEAAMLLKRARAIAKKELGRERDYGWAKDELALVMYMEESILTSAIFVRLKK